jgi:hypothetical protein
VNAELAESVLTIGACGKRMFTLNEARSAASRILRDRGVHLEPTDRCPACRSYHLVFKVPYLRERSLEHTILSRLANGFRTREIAHEVQIPDRKISLFMTRATQDVGAMSRSHLIAIATYFGIVLLELE